eukprot:24373_1
MSNASLDGSLMIMISGNDAKRMIKEQMLQFMTQKTLDIMFKCFDVFKEKYPHKIKSKSAADIAAIIYRYPIQNVIRRIQDENITGEQFEDIRDIIEQETGWKKSEIYQIESILLKHHTFTKSQFEQNMNKIFMEKHGHLLSKEIINTIKDVISQNPVHIKIPSNI